MMFDASSNLQFSTINWIVDASIFINFKTFNNSTFEGEWDYLENYTLAKLWLRVCVCVCVVLVECFWNSNISFLAIFKHSLLNEWPFNFNYRRMLPANDSIYQHLLVFRLSAIVHFFVVVVVSMRWSRDASIKSKTFS